MKAEPMRVPMPGERRSRAVAASMGSRWRLYGSLEDLDEHFSPAWMTGSVAVGRGVIDFAFQPHPDTDRLAVIFNSQQNADASLKLFTWQKVASGLHANRLFISDPTLYFSEKATLGWYTVANGFNFQSAISSLIAIVAGASKSTSIITLGSSAGGLPALVQAAAVQDGHAIILAPSLTIPGFHQKKPLEYWVSECNDASDVSEIQKSYPDVIFEAAQLWERDRSIRERSLVTIFQSVGDSLFIANSLDPFLERVGVPAAVGVDVDAAGISLRWGRWGDGHVPPSVGVLESVIDQMNIWTGRVSEFVYRVADGIGA